MLSAIWTALTAAPAFFSGLFGSINKITAAISNERIAMIGAQTAEDKALIQSRLEALLARRDVMIAESAHSKLNIIMRTTLALGPAAVLTKLLAWDKVVGSIMGCAGEAGRAARCAVFNTDVLDPNLWNVIMVVVGFYFLADGVSTTARILKLK